MNQLYQTVYAVFIAFRVMVLLWQILVTIFFVVLSYKLEALFNKNRSTSPSLRHYAYSQILTVLNLKYKLLWA